MTPRADVVFVPAFEVDCLEQLVFVAVFTAAAFAVAVDFGGLSARREQPASGMFVVQRPQKWPSALRAPRNWMPEFAPGGPSILNFSFSSKSSSSPSSQCRNWLPLTGFSAVLIPVIVPSSTDQAEVSGAVQPSSDLPSKMRCQPSAGSAAKRIKGRRGRQRKGAASRFILGS